MVKMSKEVLQCSRHGENVKRKYFSAVVMVKMSKEILQCSRHGENVKGSTVCIGYKVTGCKNIAVITMEFQKITIKTCFFIVKISGKTISAIAIYRV